jgi:hypothetical protein
MAAITASGCVRRTDSDEQASDAPATRRFTPQEFNQYVYQHTKAEVRTEFGEPDYVDENDDRWNYFAENKRLVVVDPDAGRKLNVQIQFVGIGGPGDYASGAAY